MWKKSLVTILNENFVTDTYKTTIPLLIIVFVSVMVFTKIRKQK